MIVEIVDLQADSVITRGPAIGAAFENRVNVLQMCLPCPGFDVSHEGTHEIRVSADNEYIERERVSIILADEPDNMLEPFGLDGEAGDDADETDEGKDDETGGLRRVSPEGDEACTNPVHRQRGLCADGGSEAIREIANPYAD